MDHFTSEFTTILVYIQQVLAYKIIEFIQSDVTQNFDFGIIGVWEAKS